MAIHEASCLNSSSSSDQQAKTTKKKSSPRRWFVLVSGYLIMFLCTGFPFNVSVINAELLRAFKKSKTETALVQSIMVGALYVAGTLCGKSVARYGARVTGIAGGLLVTLGLVLSFFAQSIPHLIVTLGLVSGIGFSATFISALTSVGEHFEGHSKLMALSFLTFGSGCGGITLPFLLHFLIEEFGWRGCLLITGGLMANIAPFFAVCRQLSVSVQQITENKSDELNTEAKPEGDGFTKSLRALGKNKVYLTHVVAMCCTLPVINSSLVFMIDFLKTQGFDSETAILLYLYSQIATTVFALVPSLCKKYIPHTSVLIIPAYFTLIGSSVTAFLPHADTYAQFVVLLVCLEMTLGVSITTISMTTMKVVGLKDYSAGLGVLMTLIGISGSIAGPIVGYFVDLTGSYTKPFYGMSACLGLAGGLFVLAAVLKRKSNNNQSDHVSDITVVEGDDNPTFSI
ncbi:monocarboxylate transporter 6-like isoform X1 [Mizuhopecten yessoensis]|uniref:monocarboxylate transporter 6-like isoform X1 n=1 Tax=Mizuhopecten yessoensis TaxID=6573 RepID=UPI000B45E4A4|nr:monocarboxylate transporter 6-like isoform X1 [Mizuhopecten yessoensis]